MIVKNEEEVLERCLSGIASAMDEIIIVDTGSTDRTKEIARKYTSKIYDFEWCNDFAKARNFAFSKATGDYIYSADADEVMDEENLDKLMKLKQVILPEIDIVQMYYCNQLEMGTTYNFDEEYRPKLFKRLREFLWVDPVHESVRLEPIVFDSDIRIQHCPLRPHQNRDFAIFKETLAKGESLSKKLRNMYAKELFISGDTADFVAAKEYFQGIAEDENSSMDEIVQASCVVAKAARLTEDVVLFLKYTLKNFVNDPCAEICCELGEFYFGQKDYKEAALWFYNAAYETESQLDIRCNKELPIRGMIRCYEALGDTETAAMYEKELEK